MYICLCFPVWFTLESKASRDEQVVLNAPMVTWERKMHYTPCVMKRHNSFFSPNIFWIIPQKWIVFSNNTFHAFHLKIWQWLAVIDITVKECRKQPLDNVGQNLLRHITRRPIFLHSPWQKCLLSQIKRLFPPSPIAMLFVVTQEMHAWAAKPKQHCTRGGEGANLFFLDTMVPWRKIENCIEMSQQFCRGL